MKLISWNVNGLRACMQKGFMDFFRDMDADIFCLQETKMQEGQLEVELPGYYQYWNSAEKKGYSGTAMFTKREPLQVTYGIGVEEHDHEGRVITAEFEEYFVITVYTPNSQRELTRLAYRMQWEEAFLNYLNKLKKEKPVIFCGDLNVAHEEIDLKNPKTNHKNAGFTDEERACFSRVIENGYIDTFRYFYPEVTGVYSWWSYMFQARAKNVGWRIDYFVVSDNLKDKLTDAKIHTQVLGSDHCPVELDISQEKEDVMPRLSRSFFTRDGITVAKKLLGKILVHDTKVGTIRGIITEVESYMGEEDKGSHTYGGKRTERTDSMYHMGGASYVYLIYGMYCCMNIACMGEGIPQAVLLRSVVPADEESQKRMQELRLIPVNQRQQKKGKDCYSLNKLPHNIVKHLADGPGKLCIAMDITGADNDLDMVESDSFYVTEGIEVRTEQIKTGKRIGIDYAEEAADYLWRFYL